MVELEEQEDEGACYAFQIAGNRIVFISGQDFYASARFPNNDFSLIHIYREDGALLEGFIEKRGTKLNPSRKIPSEMKEKMEVPDHLKVIDGTLDQLESLLAPAST